MPIQNIPKPDGGIEPTKEGRYKQLGKFTINMHFLNENVLLLKYLKTYAPAPGLKRTSISSNLVDVFKELLDTNQVNYRLLKRGSQKERELFDAVVKKSGIGPVIHFNAELMAPSVEDDTDRWNVLKGEILAGNTNPVLVVEMQSILKRLIEYGKVEKDEGNEIINILKEMVTAV